MGAPPGRGDVWGGLCVHAEAQVCMSAWAEQWLANPKLGFAIHGVAHARARAEYTSQCCSLMHPA